jgi:hypothetical protein
MDELGGVGVGVVGSRMVEKCCSRREVGRGLGFQPNGT